MRWVQHFVPEFEKRWNHFASKSGQSWRVNETYVKIRGVWTYLYRAIDRDGKTVDFRLSPRRENSASQITKTSQNRACDLERGALRMINAEGISPIAPKPEICSRADATWSD